MAKRSSSSQRWLERQRRDRFARRAADADLGSRAHFKLEALDRRFKLIGRHSRVVELGAAPGGWTRYLSRRATHGLVVAVDHKPMAAPPGVTVLEGDIFDDGFATALAAALGDARADLVLSDMAPNISGIRARDQAASMALADAATEIAARFLHRGGHLAVKLFQGEGVDAWVAARREDYDKAVLAKPQASRRESREVYGVALGKH